MSNISVRNLSFTYPDGTHALRDISFTISDFESVGIIGANGAGKSTLINHLNGFFLPQVGEISVSNIHLTKKNLELIRKKVGIVFQNPDDQLFTSRIYDDIAFGPENLGLHESEIEKIVEQQLRDLHLWELRDKPPSHLSHGQKRFCAIASILVMNPEIIIMDEPSSDLDPKNRRKLISLIKNLNATKLIISHDLDFIWETCSRVLLISDGQIVADQASKEILKNKTILEQHSLELPLRFQNCE